MSTVVYWRSRRPNAAGCVLVVCRVPRSAPGTSVRVYVIEAMVLSDAVGENRSIAGSKARNAAAPSYSAVGAIISVRTSGKYTLVACTPECGRSALRLRPKIASALFEAAYAEKRGSFGVQGPCAEIDGLAASALNHSGHQAEG